MTEKPDRKPSLILMVAGALLLLLAGYAGTYYALVTPTTNKFQNMVGASLLVTVPRYGQSDEDERGVAARAFAPVHWLDRRIRPHVWPPRPTKDEWNAFQRQGLPGPFWEPTPADWEELRRRHTWIPPK